MITKDELVGEVVAKFLLEPGPHTERIIHKIYNDLEGQNALQKNLDIVGENLEQLLMSSGKFGRSGPGKWELRDVGNEQTANLQNMLANAGNKKRARGAGRGAGGRGGGRVGGIPRFGGGHPNGGGFKHAGQAPRGHHHQRPMGTHGSAFRSADPPAPPPQQRPPPRRDLSPPRRDPSPRGMYKDNDYDRYGGYSNDGNRSRGGERFGGQSNSFNQQRRSPSPPTRYPNYVDDRRFNASRGFFDESAYDARRSPPARSRWDYSPDQHRNANDYRYDDAPRSQRGFDDRRRDNSDSRSPPRFSDRRYASRSPGRRYASRSPGRRFYRRASSRSPSPILRRQSPYRDQHGGPSARDDADANRLFPRPLSPQTSVRPPAMNRSTYRQEPLRPSTSGGFGSMGDSSFRSSGLEPTRPEPPRNFNNDFGNMRGPKSAPRTSSPEYSQHSDSDSITAIPPPGILATSANQRSIARADALAVKPDPSVDPHLKLAAMFNAQVDISDRDAPVPIDRSAPRLEPQEFQATWCEQLLNDNGNEMDLVDLFRSFEKRFGEEFPGDNYLSKIKFLLALQARFPAILGQLTVDEKRGVAIWGSAPPPRPMDEEGELTALIEKFVSDIQTPHFTITDVVKNLRRITRQPEHVIARKLTYVLFERNKARFRYSDTRHEEVARLNVARGTRSDYTVHKFVNRQHPMFKDPRRGERVEIEMLSYTSVNRFIVRLSEDTTRFVNMMSEIQSVYGDETRFHRRLRQGEYEPNDAVVYRTKEQQNGPLRWHRGIVMEEYDHAGRVCVNLVDHGNWSFANASDLLPLLPQFMVHPPFGLPCALYKQRMRESEHWKKSFLGQKYDPLFIMVKGQGDMEKERRLPVDLFLVEKGAIVDIATAMEDKDGYGSDSCDEF